MHSLTSPTWRRRSCSASACCWLNAELISRLRMSLIGPLERFLDGRYKLKTIVSHHFRPSANKTTLKVLHRPTRVSGFSGPPTRADRRSRRSKPAAFRRAGRNKARAENVGADGVNYGKRTADPVCLARTPLEKNARAEQTTLKRAERRRAMAPTPPAHRAQHQDRAAPGEQTNPVTRNAAPMRPAASIHQPTHGAIRHSPPYRRMMSVQLTKQHHVARRRA